MERFCSEDQIKADEYEEEVEGKELEVTQCPLPEFLEGLDVRPAVPESEMQEDASVREMTHLDYGDAGAHICFIAAWNDPSEVAQGTGIITDIEQIGITNEKN